MKTIFKIFLITVYFFTFHSFAQSNTSQKDSSSKSSITFYNLSGDNFFLPKENSFRIDSRFTFQNLNLLNINDSSTIWLRTRMMVTYGESNNENNFVNISDMLHPYLNFYIESKNVSLFRRVLGMAQLGAVGYMAYKHIKKYGLFHQP